MNYGLWGQIAAGIPNYKVGHGAPLGIQDQTHPMSPVTSGAMQKKALQMSDTHCYLSPGIAHALLLVPKALGTAYMFLRVTDIFKGLATRSSLHNLSEGPYHCQVVDTGY